MQSNIHNEHAAMNLFTYGSLMYQQIWSKVVNGKYDSRSAKIAGYKRWKVIGELYPVIKPSHSHESLEGVLYRDIQPSDLSKLDRFEGELYFKEKVMAIDEMGYEWKSIVYVLKPEWYNVINYTPWSTYWFERYGIHLFLDEEEGDF